MITHVDLNGNLQDHLDDLLGSLVGDGEPGFAIGVYRDGSLIASATAGAAIIEHDVRITERTAFDIASVSKHMTSACVLLLARDGKLRLDRDVREMIPELALTSPITLRQCLTHTAGVRDYFALCGLAGVPVSGISENRFMHVMTGQQDLDFAPGSAFSYSNTGYVLAAVLVRRATGDSLARFARDRLFGPLGMTATHFRDDVSLLVPRLANGYLAAQDSFRRCDVTEETVGDGAVITTIADLADWHAFMCSGAILGADIRDELCVTRPIADGSRLDYALGVEAIDVAGVSAWWHSGSWAGYRSAVIYLLGERAGVSVLANRNDHNASLIAFAVARALITGESASSCYAGEFGRPASRDVTLRQRDAVTGLWHDEDQDLFLDVRVAEPDLISVRLAGTENLFRFCVDGTWRGIGPASASSYAMQDGCFVPGRVLSGRAEGCYRRVPLTNPVDEPPAVPTGTYLSGELNAYADVASESDGAALVTIGLADPRLLRPTGSGVWRDHDLTMRVDPAGPGLLISTPGARRVRFGHVAGPPPPGRGVIRGLRSLG
jgi:CubicO group peptidase (beta-lactamase class C family)